MHSVIFCKFSSYLKFLQIHSKMISRDFEITLSCIIQYCAMKVYYHMYLDKKIP